MSRGRRLAMRFRWFEVVRREAIRRCGCPSLRRPPEARPVLPPVGQAQARDGCRRTKRSEQEECGPRTEEHTKTCAHYRAGQWLDDRPPERHPPERGPGDERGEHRAEYGEHAGIP